MAPCKQADKQTDNQTNKQTPCVGLGLVSSLCFCTLHSCHLLQCVMQFCLCVCVCVCVRACVRPVFIFIVLLSKWQSGNPTKQRSIANQHLVHVDIFFYPSREGFIFTHTPSHTHTQTHTHTLTHTHTHMHIR